MTWDNTPQGALYGIMVNLENNLATTWGTWQTAINNGPATYTLPTIPPKESICLNCAPPGEVEGYNVITSNFDPPRSMGNVVVAPDYKSTFDVICHWYLLHDGVGTPDMVKSSVASLVQLDIRQMILLTLRSVNTGLLTDMALKLNSVEDVGGSSPRPRPFQSSGLYSVSGSLILRLEQDTQYE